MFLIIPMEVRSEKTFIKKIKQTIYPNKSKKIIKLATIIINNKTTKLMHLPTIFPKHKEIILSLNKLRQILGKL